jgi:hypothetical protein
VISIRKQKLEMSNFIEPPFSARILRVDNQQQGHSEDLSSAISRGAETSSSAF